MYFINHHLKLKHFQGSIDQLTWHVLGFIFYFLFFKNKFFYL